MVAYGAMDGESVTVLVLNKTYEPLLLELPVASAVQYWVDDPWQEEIWFRPTASEVEIPPYSVNLLTFSKP